MSRRNGHKHRALIHTGKLHASHPNMLQCLGLDCPHDGCAVRLAAEVEYRVRQVVDIYGKITGNQFKPDGDLKTEFLLWRSMILRHKGGDFRHTEKEYRAMGVNMQWSLDLNCKLKGQSPKKLDL